jgi:CDP-diacylglycerol--glycerol-3-phosphate 3-phosphatidyltransferase
MTEQVKQLDGGVMNLPNRLTLARMVMAPVFVVLMSLDTTVAYVLGYAVFAAAMITDYYDGKIARARNIVSNFGKLWDPVADKVITAAAFVMLMPLEELAIPAWTHVAILAREFVVTGARSYAASDGLVIGANRWGKAKTILQTVYVLVFLFFMIVGRVMAPAWPTFTEQYYIPGLQYASWLAIVTVAVFTLYTGVQFARVNWESFGLGKSR